MSTLYLVQQGTTLCKEHGRFLVKSRESETAPPALEIPIREVEQILVFGNIQLTTSALSACLDASIPVLFLSHAGAYKGHLWSAIPTTPQGDGNNHGCKFNPPTQT